MTRRQEAFRTCAVCNRTLLQGERAARYSPGGDDHWVDVCALCLDQANEYGWLKEGTPRTPIVPEAPRRRRRSWNLGSLFETRREIPEPVLAEPVLRRLSPDEQLLVEAAELFNKSQHSRTIAGVAKSLGEARVSMIPLSGTNAEIVITIAWEISWYQYRVTPDSAQPVRLAERGQDPGELESKYVGWNARLADDGRLLPQIAPV